MDSLSLLYSKATYRLSESNFGRQCSLETSILWSTIIQSIPIRAFLSEGRIKIKPGIYIYI